MKRLITVFALAAALAGCDLFGGGGGKPEPTPTPTPTPKPTASATTTPPSGGARSVSEETDDFLFEYSYPSQAGRIPALAALLDSRMAKNRDDLASEAVQARRDARSNGFPYNKHSYSAAWKVVADLPGWLSLSQEVDTYTGGAHGNSALESLVWDKQAGKALDAIALFSSPDALDDALGKKFCDALNRERAKRREAPVPAHSDDEFDKCPAIGDLEVLVGSSNRRTFNRLTIYAGPYVAGPYVEGAYEVNLNVDRAILGAVKPEYRAAFTAR